MQEQPTSGMSERDRPYELSDSDVLKVTTWVRELGFRHARAVARTAAGEKPDLDGRRRLKAQLQLIDSLEATWRKHAPWWQRLFTR
jgi:hypothetical protein